MSDTGPAALAEIIQDEKKFRTYMVLTTQEFKADLASHKIEDRRQFEELKAGQGNVTSSVNTLEKDKSKLIGAKWTIGVVIVGFAWLFDVALHIIEHLKP